VFGNNDSRGWILFNFLPKRRKNPKDWLIGQFRGVADPSASLRYVFTDFLEARLVAELRGSVLPSSNRIASRRDT
jgi:hypothetical protein